MFARRLLLGLVVAIVIERRVVLSSSIGVRQLGGIQRNVPKKYGAKEIHRGRRQNDGTTLTPNTVPKFVEAVPTPPPTKAPRLPTVKICFYGVNFDASDSDSDNCKTPSQEACNREDDGKLYGTVRGCVDGCLIREYDPNEGTADFNFENLDGFAPTSDYIDPVENCGQCFTGRGYHRRRQRRRRQSEAGGFGFGDEVVDVAVTTTPDDTSFQYMCSGSDSLPAAAVAGAAVAGTAGGSTLLSTIFAFIMYNFFPQLWNSLLEKIIRKTGFKVLNALIRKASSGDIPPKDVPGFCQLWCALLAYCFTFRCKTSDSNCCTESYHAAACACVSKKNRTAADMIDSAGSKVKKLVTEQPKYEDVSRGDTRNEKQNKKQNKGGNDGTEDGFGFDGNEQI